MCIEVEDNAMRKTHTIGNVISPKSLDKGISFDNMTGNEIEVDSQPCIINQIIRELETEDFEITEDCISPTAQDLEVYQLELGLHMNQEGRISPISGKPKGKRGRKSLKELRESEGLAKEQRKIDELLNTGKGKCPPKAP